MCLTIQWWCFLVLFYFFYDYKNFQRCAFVIIASFMVYYVIYDFLPVVGPTFYFKAIGMDSVSKGIFPAVGHYFNTHTDCIPSPGYPNGIFYQLVESAKEAGERPTAAFPSSHVGISTVCMLLAWRTQNRWLFGHLYPSLPSCAWHGIYSGSLCHRHYCRICYCNCLLLYLWPSLA